MNMNVLAIALEGWAGVFGVTIVIILLVTLLNKIFKK